MRTLEYAPRAELDLIDIHACSISHWGEARADRYIDDIRTALEWLRDNPFAARLRTEIAPPVRVWPVESHVAL